MDLDSKTIPSKAMAEVWVWLCGMGLVTCLCMIAGLLGLILYKGSVVFWPKQVMLVEYESPSGQLDRLAGNLISKRKPVSRLYQMDTGAMGAEQAFEYRFFVGNRELSGENYVNLSKSDIKILSQGSDYWVGERIEFGKAIFKPLEIALSDTNSVPATQEEFSVLLRSKLQEAADRREQIRRLEKIKIGGLNQKLARLNRLERKFSRNNPSPGSDEMERLHRIRAKRKSLSEDYSVYEAEVRSLHQALDFPRLHYLTASGIESEVPLHQFLDLYRPASMSWWQKITHFYASIKRFITDSPREANTAGGIFPAIVGTFIMTVLMSAAVVPFGVLAAVYLREYAQQGQLVRLVRISVLNLAGVPSIVYGVFGLGFFIYFVGGSIDSLFFSDKLPVATFGTGGILWASLTLAIMTVPVVIVATEEALASVPFGVREASLACGASKWQTTYRVVLPASIPGILTGLILAMARGAGEVAPLMLVGVVKLAPGLPIDSEPPFIHFERKFMHLGFHIYDLGFQSPNAEAALPLLYATTVFLILLILTLNLGAILLRNHLRKKYVTGIF